MVNKINYEQRNVNMRQDVCDLVEGECLLRKNGERGFSLTINQIILEYFELRTPQHIEVQEGAEGKPELTIDWDPRRKNR
jgi:hypothetical protein